jgi:hypothetical protein
MKNMVLHLLVLVFSGLPLNAQSDFWQDISILSHDFKPAPIAEEVLRKEHRKVAPWIPIVGGVGLMGGLAVGATGPGRQTLDLPEVNNDTFRFSCAQEIVDVFPLRNDRGQELRITFFAEASLDRVRILNDSTLRFTLPVGVNSETVVITVENENGLAGRSTVLVLIDNDVTTTAQPDTFDFQATTTLRANVLDNDIGPSLRLTSVTRIDEVPASQLDFGQDGSIGVTFDIQGYGGIYNYEYTIRDACGNSSTSTLTLRVSQSPCGHRYRMRYQDDICEGNTGRLSLQIDEPTGLSYLWSDGSITAVIDSLTSGTYTVTVTDEQNACSEVFEGRVPAGSGDVISDVFSRNCGDATLNFRLGLLPFIDSFLVEIRGVNVDFEPIVLGRGEHEFTNLDSFLNPGNYILLASYLRAPEVCLSNISFTLEPVVPIPELRLVSTTETCDGNTGTATFVVNEDIGRPYSIRVDQSSTSEGSSDTITITSLTTGNHSFVLNDGSCPSPRLMVDIPPCLHGGGGGEIGIVLGRALPPNSMESPVAGGPVFSPGSSLYFVAPLGTGSIQLTGNFQHVHEGATVKAQSEIMFGLTQRYLVPELPESLQVRGGFALRSDAAGLRSGFTTSLDWRPKLPGGTYFNFGSFHPFVAPWQGRLLRFELRTPFVR